MRHLDHLLGTLDIRVRWTLDLTEQALWLPSHRLLLLDLGITHHQAAQIAAQHLDEEGPVARELR